MTQHQPVPDRFKGTVTIVTGGSNGIGRSVMEEIGKEGGTVVFTGISDAGKTTAAELKGQGRDVLFLRGDMENEAFCREVVDVTIKTYGKVNNLFNNAYSFTAKALDATAEDWKRSLFVGPVGYARMIQNVAPHMREIGGGYQSMGPEGLGETAVIAGSQ